MIFPLIIAGICTFSAAVCFLYVRRFPVSEMRPWRIWIGAIELYFAGLALVTALEWLPRVNLLFMFVQPAFVVLFLWPGMETILDWRRRTA